MLSYSDKYCREGWTDRQTDSQSDGWMDGWKQMYSIGCNIKYNNRNNVCTRPKSLRGTFFQQSKECSSNTSRNVLPAG
jgi:hypothetical protein